VTSAIYAARMLGGSVAVTALGARHAADGARFEGLVAIALFATALLATLAPRDPRALAIAPSSGASLDESA
jgi:hypothetical protein